MRALALQSSLVLVLFALGANSGATANAEAAFVAKRVTVPRITTAPRIDGRLDEIGRAHV